MKTVDTVGGSLTLKQRAPKAIYEPSFKARVVAECGRAGSSIAGIALDHGLNANMVHRWLDEYEAGIGWAKRVDRQVQFIAIAMEPSAVMQEPASQHVLPSGFIGIEVTRGKSRIAIKWPVDAASACATMLGQLLT